VPIHYYGDELGIPDGDFPHKSAKDGIAHAYWWVPRGLARLLNLYINRDGCRTPMQWDSSPNAGFSPGGVAPWLPVHPDYPACNVARQREDAFSILNTHRKLLHLRRRSACLRRGALELLPDDALPAGVVGYDRTLEGRALRVMLNFSRTVRTVTINRIAALHHK
jgi:alpha-glucosidase